MQYAAEVGAELVDHAVKSSVACTPGGDGGAHNGGPMRPRRHRDSGSEDIEKWSHLRASEIVKLSLRNANPCSQYTEALSRSSEEIAKFA